jgi:hypothetical protein
MLTGPFLEFIAAYKNKVMTHAYFSDDDFTIHCQDGSTITKSAISELETLYSDFQELHAKEASDLLARRQALLGRLGITEEEAKLLLGGN